MAKPNPFAKAPAKGGKCPDCGKSPCACKSDAPKGKGKMPFVPFGKAKSKK